MKTYISILLCALCFSSAAQTCLLDTWQANNANPVDTGGTWVIVSIPTGSTLTNAMLAGDNPCIDFNAVGCGLYQLEYMVESQNCEGCTDMVTVPFQKDCPCDPIPPLQILSCCEIGSTVGQTPFLIPDICTGNTAFSGSGIWYTFTGTGASTEISTVNTATNFDTQIAIYTNATNCTDDFVCVGGNDDAFQGTLQSTFTFNSILGATYYVYVTGWNGAFGNYELSIDDCCGSTVDCTCTVDILANVNNCTATIDIIGCASYNNFILQSSSNCFSTPSTTVQTGLFDGQVININTDGSYRVVATSNQGCTDVSSGNYCFDGCGSNPCNLSVNAGTDEDICITDLSSFLNGTAFTSGGTGTITYNWSVSPFTSFFGFNTLNNVGILAGASLGSYTFTLTATDANNCMDSDSKIVNIINCTTPCTSVVSASESNCTITATVTNCPNPTYTFINPSNQIVATNTTGVLSGVNVNGNWTVTVTGCTGCTGLSTTVNVTGCEVIVDCNCSPTFVVDQINCEMVVTMNGSGCSNYSWLINRRDNGCGNNGVTPLQSGSSNATIPITVDAGYEITWIPSNGCSGIASPPCVDVTGCEGCNEEIDINISSTLANTSCSPTLLTATNWRFNMLVDFDIDCPSCCNASSVTIAPFYIINGIKTAAGGNFQISCGFNNSGLANSIDVPLFSLDDGDFVQVGYDYTVDGGCATNVSTQILESATYNCECGIAEQTLTNCNVSSCVTFTGCNAHLFRFDIGSLACDDCCNQQTIWTWGFDKVSPPNTGNIDSGLFGVNCGTNIDFDLDLCDYPSIVAGTYAMTLAIQPGSSDCNELAGGQSVIFQITQAQIDCCN